jgi:hypothetical protein
LTKWIIMSGGSSSRGCGGTVFQFFSFFIIHHLLSFAALAIHLFFRLQKFFFYFFTYRRFRPFFESKSTNVFAWVDLGSMLWSRFCAIFSNFRRKNWRFFSKTKVMIKSLHNLA